MKETEFVQSKIMIVLNIYEKYTNKKLCECDGIVGTLQLAPSVPISYSFSFFFSQNHFSLNSWAFALLH